MSSFLGNSAFEPSEVACKLLARMFRNPLVFCPYGIPLGGDRRDTGDCTED
jgi:hypothetical protein